MDWGAKFESQDREFYVDLSSGETTFDFHTAAG